MERNKILYSSYYQYLHGQNHHNNPFGIKQVDLLNMLVIKNFKVVNKIISDWSVSWSIPDTRCLKKYKKEEMLGELLIMLGKTIESHSIFLQYFNANLI